MDRRGVIATLCASAFTVGAAALIGAATIQSGSPYFDLLLYCGIAGVLIGVFGLLALVVFPAKTKSPEASPVRKHINQGVISHNQSGGITAGTVVIGKPNRQIDEALKQRLLNLPKGMPVEVEAPMGEGEAIRHGEAIATFLNTNGYSATVAIAMGRPFPQGEVQIEQTATYTSISVGPQ